MVLIFQTTIQFLGDPSVDYSNIFLKDCTLISSSLNNAISVNNTTSNVKVKASNLTLSTPKPSNLVIIGQEPLVVDGLSDFSQ